MENYVEESHSECELDDREELFQSLDHIKFLKCQLEAEAEEQRSAKDTNYFSHEQLLELGGG